MRLGQRSQRPPQGSAGFLAGKQETFCERQSRAQCAYSAPAKKGKGSEWFTRFPAEGGQGHCDSRKGGNNVWRQQRVSGTLAACFAQGRSNADAE